MSKLGFTSVATTALLALLSPGLSAAGPDDAMACSVSVTYSLNNTVSLAYAKDFQVSVAAPFSDDFSTATRFRFFDAAMTIDAGVPVVAIAFDADVSVFNSVTFGASLRVRDETHGDTTSGDSGFFTSVPGAAGGHRTHYTLTCARARN